MANFDFIVDVENQRLINAFLSTRAAPSPRFVFGDQPTVSVRLVESNSNNADLPWRQLDLDGQTIRLALGNPGGDPTDGTFELTFDGDTATALDFDIEAQGLEDALNLLASVITAGGVTVTKYGQGGYKILFVADGVRTLITAGTGDLLPSSSAFIVQAVEGDVSTQEAQILAIETDPAAYVELTTDIAAPAVGITVVRDGVTGTVSEQQRVIITGEPYAGTYSLTFDAEESTAIPYDASTDEIKSAIEALASVGVGNVTVTGSALDYTIEFNSSLGDIGAGTADASNLSGSIGKTGTLDLNVAGVLELLGGESTVQTKMEIVRYTTSGGISDTVYQESCTVRQDVIPDSPPSQTPLPDYPDRSEVFPLPKEVSGTSYTLELDDISALLYTTNASAVTITVPPESSVDFGLGSAIVISQAAAGKVTIAEGAGVTVLTPELNTTRAQESSILLTKYAADEWRLSGDLDFI